MRRENARQERKEREKEEMNNIKDEEDEGSKGKKGKKIIENREKNVILKKKEKVIVKVYELEDNYEKEKFSKKRTETK